MHERIRQVVARALGVPAEQVNEDTSMSTCPAWDSLKHFELILAIEAAFQVRFPMDAIGELTSVARLHDQLTETSQSKAA